MRLELRIVNLLGKNQDRSFTMNEIAQKLNEAYSYVHRVTTMLIKDRAITKNIVGHAFQCTLNRASAKANALLRVSTVLGKEGYLKYHKRRLHPSTRILSTAVVHIKKKTFPIFQRYGVKRAAIFGSYARGEMRRRSDVDLLVELDENMSLLDVAGLKLDLEEALGRKVDLVEYTMLKPLLRERILREQKILL